MQTTTAIARQITTVSAEITVLTFKTHFFVRVGSRMSAAAYDAFKYNRTAEPEACDIAYVEADLGRAMTAQERVWFAEGFAAEYAFCQSLEEGSAAICFEIC